MKYVEIKESDTLSKFSERVGHSVVDQIIADNELKRVPNIGKQWKDKCDNIIQTNPVVPAQKKVSILNTLIESSDIYETAALATEDTWKVLAATKAFPDFLYVSDRIETSIPDSYTVLGNKEAVSQSVYSAINDSLLTLGYIDSAIFSTFSTIKDVGLLDANTSTIMASNPLDWFSIPDGEVMLYSSLSDAAINIPAYPEEHSDSRAANYTQMPDILYQYEPWQLYQSSGPRTNTYEFNLHRDMWTGDHSDGKANELIRFCQAQCYPIYRGSSVHTSTVTLYIGGSALITGVMNNVDVTWSGPIGQDGYHLAFKLSFTITEVSPSALDYNAIISKPLIG